MPKHLKNDHIFKRPLIWLITIGLSSMTAYVFLPWHILSNPEKKTPLPTSNIAVKQQSLPPKSIPERQPPSHIQPNKGHLKADKGKFVKNYLEFHDSKNFYKTITESGLNPTLIEQLEPLKRRLSHENVSGVDILYANYVKQETFNPKNSKVIAVRIHQGEKTNIFFSKSEKNTIYFYDVEGNAPELAMDRCPLSSYERISSPFNPKRRHPITHRIRPHNGTDFKAPYGTPVHSTGDGVVKFAGWQRGYGKVIIIEHVDNYETRYAHLSAIKTSAGEKIKRGQVIGNLGNTGASTGAHLHYEVRKEGIPYDPMTIKLPSTRPLEKNYLYAWRYRCEQQTKAMNEIAITGKTKY